MKKLFALVFCTMVVGRFLSFPNLCLAQELGGDDELGAARTVCVCKCPIGSTNLCISLPPPCDTDYEFEDVNNKSDCEALNGIDCKGWYSSVTPAQSQLAKCKLVASSSGQ